MAEIKLQPLGGRILIEPEAEETKTASGIVLAPTASKEKPQKGKVIKLGTGGNDKDGNKIVFQVKVGDTVLFKKYAPDEFEIDNETYLVIDQDDILAVIK